MCAEVLALIGVDASPLIALPSLPLAFSVISRADFRFETSVEFLQESVPIIGLHPAPGHRLLTGHAAFCAPPFLSAVLTDTDTWALFILHDGERDR